MSPTPGALVTAEEKRRIRAAKAKGLTWRELIKQFGRSASTISRVLNEPKPIPPGKYNAKVKKVTVGKRGIRVELEARRKAKNGAKVEEANRILADVDSTDVSPELHDTLIAFRQAIQRLNPDIASLALDLRSGALTLIILTKKMFNMEV